jgi:hypothetical protein
MTAKPDCLIIRNRCLAVCDPAFARLTFTAAAGRWTRR